MSLSTEVRTGLWTDYNKHHRWQTLQSDVRATWLKTAVGVSLALSAPYIFAIVQSTLLGIYWWLNPRGLGKSERVQSGDEARAGLIVRDAVQEARGGREILKRFYRMAYETSSAFTSRHRAGMVFVLTVFFSMFLAQIAFSGLIAAKVATDRIALLKSDTCGLWEFDVQKGGSEDASLADIAMSERERRAAEYAQECYGAEKKSDAILCNFFYSPSIPYTKKRDTCPFDDHSICYYGYTPDAAVTFDTGLVDSSNLGINQNPTYKFRRTTTCTPLNVDSPHVRHVNIGDGGYLYYYGALYDTGCSTSNHTARKIQNYTLYTTGKPFQWLAPVYRVDPFATYLGDPRCDYYQPNTTLSAPGLGIDPPGTEKPSLRNKTLTIIFITPLHILYTQPSNDPIFRADKATRPPGSTRDYYYNSNPKARALACIDETQLCDHSGEQCWHIHDAPKTAKLSPAYWYMKHALNNSNTYDSIKDRLGSALLAQQRVGQFRSLPLPDDHWTAESEQFFRTSLARPQFDAWRIASGEDSNNPTYHNVITKDEGNTTLCGMYKFRSVGYVNIQIRLFIPLLFALPFFALMSTKTKDFEKTLVSMWASIINGGAWVKKKLSFKTPKAGESESSQQSEVVTNNDASTVTATSPSLRSSDLQQTVRTGLMANENVGGQSSRKRDYGTTNSASGSAASSIHRRKIDDQDSVSDSSSRRSEGDSAAIHQQQYTAWVAPIGDIPDHLTIKSVQTVFRFPINDERIDATWEPLVIHSIFLKYIPAVIHSPKDLWDYFKRKGEPPERSNA